MTRWITDRDVEQMLGITYRTLLRWMQATPDGITRPWRQIGRTRRWDPRKIERWLEEMDEWRALSAAAAGGSSAGGTRTAASGRGAARRNERPARSAEKSKTSSPKGSAGRLVMLTRSPRRG